MLIRRKNPQFKDVREMKVFLRNLSKRTLQATKRLEAKIKKEKDLLGVVDQDPKPVDRKPKRRFKSIREMKNFLKELNKRNAAILKRLVEAIEREEESLNGTLPMVSEPPVKYRSKREMDK